jgi:hypothetical protein
MSSQGKSGGFFNTLIGSLRRSGTARPEPLPEPEDLGLKALRQVSRSRGGRERGMEGGREGRSEGGGSVGSVEREKESERG